MSVRMAVAFDQFDKLSGVELKDFGFYNFQAYNAVDASNQAWKPVLTPMGITSDNITTQGHSWVNLPKIITPSAVKNIYMCARVKNFKATDANTCPLGMLFNGSSLMNLFQGKLATLTTDSWLEVWVDRVNNKFMCYIDNVLVNTIQSSGANVGTMSTLGWAPVVACKDYSAGTVAANTTYVDDILVIEDDSIWPSARLGSVKLRSLPVTVSAVSGLDSSDLSAVQTKLATTLTNGSTAGAPTNKSPVKAQAVNAYVDFSLNLSDIPTDRQVGVAFFVAATRRSSTTAQAVIEQVLDGTTKTLAALDMSTGKDTDRYNYTTGLSTRAADGTARSLNAATYRLKFTES